MGVRTQGSVGDWPAGQRDRGGHWVQLMPQHSWASKVLETELKNGGTEIFQEYGCQKTSEWRDNWQQRMEGTKDLIYKWKGGPQSGYTQAQVGTDQRQTASRRPNQKKHLIIVPSLPNLLYSILISSLSGHKVLSCKLGTSNGINNQKYTPATG
ncbi:hypothetical protein EDC04DRAFT_2605305 [Pisolithus marmoratus]|nr:hypothetical protein EDC04DRAFT_2605305 [Pisolithus marmoratus]